MIFIAFIENAKKITSFKNYFQIFLFLFFLIRIFFLMIFMFL